MRRATALFVTGTLLDSAEMSISPVVYSLSGMALAAIFGVVLTLARKAGGL